MARRHRRVRVLQRSPARCHKCGAPVRLRMTEDGYKTLVRALDNADLGDDTVLQTYQCARRLPDGTLCNALVEIRVRDWKEIGW